MCKLIVIIFILSLNLVFAQQKIGVLLLSNHNEDLTLRTINIVSDNTKTQNHSVINIAGQAVIGPLSAFGFTFIPMAAAWGNNNNSYNAILGTICVSAYIFGSACGVYWIAKSENPELSFWGTVGYSAIGFGVGASLAGILSTQYLKMPATGGFIAAFCPILASMLYASLIADWPQQNGDLSTNINHLSHKDLFERDKLFNIELFRISL